DLKDSKVSRLLERHQINACVFGHLHNVQPGNSLFGIHNQIRYHLVACDYLNFVPYDLKFE
ncbi:MAG: phosphoesterase, partial [Candidatus Paceibacterota bacterium]